MRLHSGTLVYWPVTQYGKGSILGDRHAQIGHSFAFQNTLGLPVPGVPGMFLECQEDLLSYR